MSLSFSTLATIRFGYGFRPGQPVPASVDDLMAQVAAGTVETPRFPNGGIPGRKTDIAVLARALADYNKSPDAADPQAKRAYRQRFNVEIGERLMLDEHLRFAQPTLSPHGFFERLAAFWVNHFSVNAVKVTFLRLLAPLFEAEAIRPHLSGNFADLARAAVLHPAMLLFLDQQRSVGPSSAQGVKLKRGLNENLGRELLELHTLGAGGGYTQTDVRNAAYVLTGLGVDRITQMMTYKRNVAEPGSRTVLGKTYGGPVRTLSDVEDMIDDLTYAPQTRRHICFKLAAHFVADDPPAELVAAMVAAWTRSDGELMSVYAAMLHHPASWTGEGQKAKQPFEFVISGLRALQFTEADLRPRAVDPTKQKEADPAAGGMMAPTVRRLAANPFTVSSASKMGQPLWRPPSPAGFPDSFSSWIAAGQLTERIGWARSVAAKFGGKRDPRDFLAATLADAARQDTIDVVTRAPNRQIGLALVLASPEFNRR